MADPQNLSGKLGFGHQTPSTTPETSNELINLNMRVRLIEERHTNLRRIIQVNEQNMISNHKSINADLKLISSEIDELKREVELIKTKLRNIITELGNFPRKEDVKVIERYVDLLDPTRYITENEAEKIVRRILEEEKR